MGTQSQFTSEEFVVLWATMRSQKCPKVLKRGKLIDLSTTDPKYLTSDSETDSSIDSDLSEVSANQRDDKVVDVDENDDINLEEAL